jgi:hypothetical protein
MHYTYQKGEIFGKIDVIKEFMTLLNVFNNNDLTCKRCAELLNERIDKVIKEISEQEKIVYGE